MVMNYIEYILFAPLNTKLYFMLHLYDMYLATVKLGPRVWRTTSNMKTCSGGRDLIVIPSSESI